MVGLLGLFFDRWTGPPQSKVAVHVHAAVPTVTPGLPATATRTAAALPVATRPLLTPMLGSIRSYADTVSGLAFDIPANWKVDGTQGKEA